jgi:hypothetical protein
MTIAEMVNALGIRDVAFDVDVTLPIATCYHVLSAIIFRALEAATARRWPSEVARVAPEVA